MVVIVAGPASSLKGEEICDELFHERAAIYATQTLSSTFQPIRVIAKIMQFSFSSNFNWSIEKLIYSKELKSADDKA